MTTDPNSSHRRPNSALLLPPSSSHGNGHRSREASLRNVSREVAFPNSSRRAAAVARNQDNRSPTTGSGSRSEHQSRCGSGRGGEGGGREANHKMSKQRSSRSHNDRDSKRGGGIRAVATPRKEKLSRRHSRRRSETSDEKHVPLTSSTFVPENPSCSMIQRMFMDEKTADVVFKVIEKGRKRNESQKVITFPTIFYAHRCILQQCAPRLAKLCGSAGGGITSVPITDIRPNTFRCLLSYLYGVEIPEKEILENAKGLIDAAHKYNISILKLEAEACFVKSRRINRENMMKHLLYADATNCALLKEAVMDFIVANKVEVLESVALKDAPEGLLADVLAAVARGEEKSARGTSGERNRLSILRISDLRRKSHAKGLDINESREHLIAALKESCSETLSSDSS